MASVELGGGACSGLFGVGWPGLSWLCESLRTAELELLDAETTCYRSPMGHATAFYRSLHQLGIFELGALPRLRELRSAGQRTPAELINRFDLACRPACDGLLVD